MIKNNKAAMFGLDARIALAIFGALSVISGAALYRAIQQARVTSVQTQMEEIAKAVESHYLDTAAQLPYQTDSTNRELRTEGLVVNNGIAGWNGPYISLESPAAHYIKVPTRVGDINAFVHECREATGGEFSKTSCTSCNGANDCSIFIKLHGSTSNSFVLALDEAIDGSDGLNSGKFRAMYATAAASDDIRMYYKIMPVH